MSGLRPGHRVALTGATGFIGSALSRALVGAGYRVRALVRPGSAHKPLPDGVEAVMGELTDPACLGALLESGNALIHCAGAVRGARRQDFFNTNAAPIAVLARAAAAAAVSRFVLVSSLAAREPELSPYAASKRAGEAALTASGAAFDTMILRPPAVYGAGDREMLPLFRAMQRGFAPLFGDTGARFSLIHVDDFTAAVLAGLACERSTPEPLELHDGHRDGYSIADIIDAVEQIRGRPVRRIPVPSLLLDGIAGVNLLTARAVRRPPMLTPWKLRELRHPRWVCDNSALHELTGWQPAIPLSRGLRLVLQENRDSDESPAEENNELS